MESKCITPEKTLNNSDSYCFKVEKNSIQDLKTAKDSRSPSLEETECTQNLISRKTLRGRKEKIPFPKNKTKCEVCLEFSDFSKEDLISCSTCKCFFHKSCYEQYELCQSSFVEASSYKCKRCFYALKNNKPIEDYKCFICGNYNGVLSRNSLNNLFYHKICINLLNEFKDLEGDDLCKENIRRWRYKNSCRYCGEKLSKAKAVIKCKNPKCKEFFHIPCAIHKGMIFDLNFMKQYYKVSSFDEIPFYCSNHNKKISFMYKTHIVNDNNYLNCKKNLCEKEFDLYDKEEQTFFEYFGDLNKGNFIDNNSTILGSIENKSKSNFSCKNSNTISIIEEENANDNDNNCPFQNDNNEEKNKNTKKEIENLNDSFDNNDNNVFNLNFDKIFKEDNRNDDCLIDDKLNFDNHCHFLGGFLGFDNGNDYLINRQNSLDSLNFNV